jgi:ABC-type transport system involved in multi-copper enzyme maturation permease subunit
MLRTGRVEYVTGKALGQALLIALVVLLSAGMCMAVAEWKLADFEFWPTARAMLLFWPRAVGYCVPFVGVAILCSMLSSSTMSARAFSLIGMMALWAVHELADFYSDTPLAGFFNALDHLDPYFYQMRLWEPGYATVGPALAILAGLGVLYVAIGLVFYVRRDL